MKNVIRRCPGAIFWCCFVVGYNTASSDTGSFLSLSATANTRVILPCNTSKSTAVLWSFQSKTRGIATEVSIYGEITKNYKDLYELERTRVGEFNLVIKSARSSDSGQYTCDEENGVGERHLISLTVSGQDSTTNGLVQSATATKCDSEQHQPTSGTCVAPVVVLSILLASVIIILCVAMYFVWLRKSKSRQKETWTPTARAETGTIQIDQEEEGRGEYMRKVVTDLKKLVSKYNSNDFYADKVRDALTYYITIHYDKLEWCVQRMAARVHKINQQNEQIQIDVIVGLNAYGSRVDILAWQTAHSLKIPYAEMTKVGGSRREDVEKNDFLVGPKQERKIYELEMVKDACRPGQNAVIVSSVVANGGTMKAACDLLSSTFQVNVVAHLCFIKSTTYKQAVRAPTLYHVIEMEFNRLQQ